MEKKTNKIAILLVGESATGKTCLINRYINNQFLQNSTSTIGIDYRTKKINYNGADVKLEIWDSAGQEKYMAIPATFFNRADAIAVVFSLTDVGSFEKIEKWLESIYNYKGAEKVTIAICGNKKDLESERQVGDALINGLCEEKGLKYFPCSAKSGEGVPEIFDYFTQKVCEKKNIGGNGNANLRASSSSNNNFSLSKDTNNKEKKGCCKK